MAKSKGGKGGGGGSGAATGGKPKFDITAFLISNSQMLAIGIGGGAGVIMLLLGVTSALKAKSSEEIASKMTAPAEKIQKRLQVTKPEGPDDRPKELDSWAKPTEKTAFAIVAAESFATPSPRFDPITRPDSRRENPVVLGIEETQVDLVRAPMKAYDITFNAEGEPKIGVLKGKTIAKADARDLKVALDQLRINSTRGLVAYRARLAAEQKQLDAQKKALAAGTPAGQPTGLTGGEGGGPIGLAGAGNGFDTSGQRTETVIDYVSLPEMDLKRLTPAFTVVPVRMIVVHATFPLEKQWEEMRRALRLQTPQQAAAFPYTYQVAGAGGQPVTVSAVGPTFDGYEVQRRVTTPSGQVVEWQPYKYEDAYSQLIDSRKVADWFDISPTNLDSGYLPLFLAKSYDNALALPLPELVGTTEYPLPYKLKSITDTIQKLKDAAKQPDTPSAFAQRLKGATGKGMFRPRGQSGALGTDGFSSAPTVGGPATPTTTPTPTGVLAAGPNDPAGQAQVEIKHMLVRFVDPDVRPGFSYEYRIRVRMRNPNFAQENMVSRPSDAKVDILPGPWVQLKDPISVPNESFLYAFDTAEYTKKVQDSATDKGLKAILSPRDGQDAVVQVQSWMEEVRAGSGGKREPVGNWVVAEMPAGRGEYIGRKQYVRLPLWSSEARQYSLRDVQDKIPNVKVKESPKGWLVDFSTQSILVDFEGGKVRQAAGPRTVTDESGVEMLIRRSDGKFEVKTSTADMPNAGRQERQATWDGWIKAVETAKANAAGNPSDPTQPFSKKPSN